MNRTTRCLTLFLLSTGCEQPATGAGRGTIFQQGPERAGTGVKFDTAQRWCVLLW